MTLTPRMRVALELLEELQRMDAEEPHAPRRPPSRRQRRAIVAVSRSLPALVRRGLVEPSASASENPRLTLDGRAVLLALRSDPAGR